MIDYRPMVSLLRLLPKERRWTPEMRAKWMAALEATTDLIVDVWDDQEDPHNPAIAKATGAAVEA